MLSIISAFLSNHKSRVVLEGQFSPTRSINSGVPQGLVLGPTLFLVYINNLPDKVLSQLAMYADDSTLYCVSPNSSNTCRCEVGVSLNNDLESVLKWGNDWLVIFKAKKTKLYCLFLALEMIHFHPFIWVYQLCLRWQIFAFSELTSPLMSVGRGISQALQRVLPCERLSLSSLEVLTS